MRKLLVASQKGGVGKTTTSINLAAAAAAGGRVLLLDADPFSSVSNALDLARHPDRQSLRAAGFPVPGILVPGLVPGLDVLSPYEDGGCSDAEFDEVIRLLATPAVREGYDCLIVDAPPFLGANPAQLLAAADEYVLVMRAEANAFRTLPAFQELVQRSRRDGHPVPMRGILLTLPEGEAPGGRWERELRGRFGTRILPHVIPFDEESIRARAASQILVRSSPEASSAPVYAAMADGLGLTVAKRTRAAARSGGSPLLAAAAAFRPTAAAAASATAVAEPPPTFAETPAPRERTPERTEEPELPTDVSLRSMPEIPVLRLPPRPSLGKPKPPAARPAGPARRPGAAANPSARRAASGEAKTANPPAKKPVSLPVTERGTPVLMWVGVAVVLGFGLRFLHIPRQMVPLAIGVAVTAGSLLLLRLLLSSAPRDAKPAPRRATPKARPKDTAGPPARPEPKKGVASRLAALTRRRGRPS